MLIYQTNDISSAFQVWNIQMFTLLSSPACIFPSWSRASFYCHYYYHYLNFSTLFPSGTRWPSANLPRRKGPVCRHRTQIWPSALFLVRQTEPSRGSAGLRHQVSAQGPWSALCQPSRFLTFTRSANCRRRYAITVWYFDADERARAKEKYLTGNVSAERYGWRCWAILLGCMQCWAVVSTSYLFRSSIIGQIGLHFVGRCSSTSVPALWLCSNRQSVSRFI